MANEAAAGEPQVRTISLFVVDGVVWQSDGPADLASIHLFARAELVLEIAGGDVAIRKNRLGALSTRPAAEFLR